MAKEDGRASIDIQLRGGDTADEYMRAYRPGAALSGSVTVMPNDDINVNSVLLQLEWHTEGRGDRDQEIVEERELSPQGVLTRGIAITEDFTFTLPGLPWSFAGYYINIVWSVNVKIDIPRARDVNVNQVFLLKPDAASVEEEDSIWG